MTLAFWELVIYYLLCFLLGTFFELYLAHHKRNNLGLLLPFLILVGTSFQAFFNFYYAFVPSFDKKVFLASLNIFVFMSLPAFFYLLIASNIAKKKQQRKQKKNRFKKHPYQRK